MSKKNAASNILDIMQHMKSKEDMEKEVHDEIEATNVTLEQIRTARKDLAGVLEAYLDVKKKIDEAKEELDSIMKAYNAAAKSSDNVVTGITNAILDARHSKIEVSVSDAAKEQLKQRNKDAISAFDKSLARHKETVEAVFKTQKEGIEKVRQSMDGIYLNDNTFWILLFGWMIVVMAIGALLVAWLGIKSGWIE